MTERYFVDSPIRGELVVLAGSEAHHLIHVMRGAPGQDLVLFDGSGSEFQGRIEKVSRTKVHVAILSGQVVDRELPFDLTLGVSLPKGDRQKWLVEKAVELGVRRIVPIEATRSVAQPVEHALVRLRRTVVEASKQCGRNRLLEIDEYQHLADFMDRNAPGACRLLAHPHRQSADAAQSVRLASAGSRRGSQAVIAAIGPEGGFTPEEVADAVDVGWRLIDLGPRILRIETAAIWLCALAVHVFGSQPPLPEGTMETEGHRR
jgi:16S rRNA (uracil1498-N3)-methyltransferase